MRNLRRLINTYGTGRFTKGRCKSRAVVGPGVQSTHTVMDPWSQVERSYLVGAEAGAAGGVGAFTGADGVFIGPEVGAVP